MDMTSRLELHKPAKYSNIQQSVIFIKWIEHERETRKTDR